MSALAIGAMVAGSAISGIMGHSASKKQAKRSKQIANLNANFIGQEFDENLRKLRLTHAQTLGQARATQGASGISDGTNESYIKEMETAFMGERNWLTKAKKSQMNITRLGGEAQSANIKAQGTSHLINQATNIAGFFK